MNMTEQQQLKRQLDRELRRTSAGPRTEHLIAELAQRAAAADLLDAGYDSVETPVGTLFVAATRVGIVRVGFESEREQPFVEDVARRVSTRLLHMPRLLDDARRQLSEYFDGRRRTFQLELDWRLSPGFRRRVLRATAQIPFGHTGSYRDVATAAGSPRAVRAAGSALATNPLPIIVPCHRVLRSDGGLGGYRGGIAMKRALLGYEQAWLREGRSREQR
jgi:methylated-DNA-[protein]-cysteine S-methyltransferase